MFTHTVRTLEGNICSFRSCPKFRLVRFEGLHFSAKQWQYKFLFILSVG